MLTDGAPTTPCVTVAIGVPMIWRYDTCHLRTSVPLTQGRNELISTNVEIATRRTNSFLRHVANVLCFALAVHALPR